MVSGTLGTERYFSEVHIDLSTSTRTRFPPPKDQGACVLGGCGVLGLLVNGMSDVARQSTCLEQEE